MAQIPIGRPQNPEVTLEDVYQEIDRLDGKVTSALNDLKQIIGTLESLKTSIAELQQTVDEKE